MYNNDAMSKSHTYRNAYDVAQYVTLYHVLVDEAVWYTIDCTREVADWIRTQEPGMYYSHTTPAYARVYGNKFDLHSSVYVLLGLRWT